MGNQSRINPRSQSGRPWLAVLLWLLCLGSASGQAATPLLLPSGLAYDAAGDLYFAESGNHLVRKLTPGGTLSVVAGTGVQGFSGDAGPATLAQLDSPRALALDASGNLFLADTHNHRIRRVSAADGSITTTLGSGVAGLSPDGLAAAATLVDLPAALAFTAAGDLLYADSRRNVVRRVDHGTGLVTTVAGSGAQGALGDGGPATAATLDAPAGLAVDAAGNVWVSDSHNQRVRRIDATTGVISTVAGTGERLSLPRGLALGPDGALYVVDAGNERIRRVDAGTGLVTTVAGSAVEGFAGDGGPATQASLASPRGIVLSPSGQPTLTDAANGRVRQVDSAGLIRTIAGVDASSTLPAGLQLTGPTSVVYGAGTLMATLGGGTAAGLVRLLEGSTPVGTGSLSGNVAILSLGSLGVGSHALQASFTGDAAHPAVLSNVLQVTVTPAPLLAAPNAVAVVYGLAIPPLTGSLNGVLSQDAGQVQVAFSSAALPLSGAGVYPITATLSGPAAGNYALTTAIGSVTVARAHSTLTLSLSLLAHVGSTTSGQPGGTISLLDGAAANASSVASATGDAQFSSISLSNGSHTLSASFAGDQNFLGSNAAPIVVTIGPAQSADFSVAATGRSDQTVSAGSDAVFTFAMTPVNGSLSSPIVLDVAGTPSGATASFSPAYLPPGSGAVPFTLTVHTMKTAGLRAVTPLVLGAVLVAFWVPRRRRPRLLACLLLVGLAGCADRINSFGQQSSTSRTYNLTVNATATSNAGTTLLHSVPVTLTIQ